MRPSELLEPADVLLDFRPTDKWQAIGDLVHHLVALGKLPVELEEAVRDAVLDRERSMSTGMERGVAIPHAAVEGVSELLAVMGVVQDGGGLDFESIDGQSARVVVLLVIPKGQKLLHIRTLADIARVLTKDSVRSKLMETREQAEAHAVLVAGEA
ncbi:MAG: PTS sugar transporter subunit IIA [Planctomycetota bacterium]|nr:PTS sugar transporter subunit IIA [Planctomycetota bacterium]